LGCGERMPLENPKGRVRDGLKKGVMLATGFSVVFLGSVVIGALSGNRISAVQTAGVIGFYYAAGAAAGLTWGLLYGFTHSCLGSAVVFTLAGIPGSLMLRVMLFGFRGWSALDLMILFVAVQWAAIVSLGNAITRGKRE